MSKQRERARSSLRKEAKSDMAPSSEEKEKDITVLTVVNEEKDFIKEERLWRL